MKTLSETARKKCCRSIEAFEKKELNKRVNTTTIFSVNLNKRKKTHTVHFVRRSTICLDAIRRAVNDNNNNTLIVCFIFSFFAYFCF